MSCCLRPSIVFKASLCRPTLPSTFHTRGRLFSNMSSAIQAAQTTLSENLGGIAQKAAPAGTTFSLDDVPDQTGKVAVVTGGSEGKSWSPCMALMF